MKKDDCFELGQITKPQGVQGEVLLFMDSDNPQHYKKIKHLFLEQESQLVPYLVEKISIQANKAIVKLDGVDNVETADTLRYMKVFLPLSELPKLPEGGYFLHELIGMQIEDSERGKMGVVKVIYELPAQNLLGVEYENAEILIPIHDEFIKQVLKNEQVIKVELPEGLLDIYLEQKE